MTRNVEREVRFRPVMLGASGGTDALLLQGKLARRRADATRGSRSPQDQPEADSHGDPVGQPCALSRERELQRAGGDGYSVGRVDHVRLVSLRRGSGGGCCRMHVGVPMCVDAGEPQQCHRQSGAG